MHASEIFSRRQVLRFAGETVAASVLLSQAVGSDAERPMIDAQKVRTNSTIVVLLAGAMSAQDSFDHKTDQTASIRGPFNGIRLASGASYSELFPELAAGSEQYSLLRAMKATSSGAHNTAYRAWLNTRGTHLAMLLSRKAKGLSYVDTVVPGVSPVFDPERAELLPGDSLLARWNEQSCAYEMSLGGESDVQRLESRLALLRCLEQHSQLSGKAVTAHVEKRATAERLTKEPLASILGDQKPEEADAFGNNPYGKAMWLASQLATQSDGSVVVVETGHWDIHNDIEKRMPESARQLDRAVMALIARYADRVTIAMRGEFGRTPVMNDAGGRDHHPLHAGIVAGPSIVAGQVYGTTDRRAEAILDGEINDTDFANLVLEASGSMPLGTLKGNARVLLKT